MVEHIVELTTTQSIVLGNITKYKCVSVMECSYWTHLKENSIQKAICALIDHHLIYLSPGG